MKNPPDPRATRTGGGVFGRVGPGPQAARRGNPHVATAGDSAVVTAWRERLGTDAAQALYTERAATAEYVMSPRREPGCQALPLRQSPGARESGCQVIFRQEFL